MKIIFKDERGIASIFVTVIFSIIISIVVLSFAIVARREQRQSIDRQLSSQAYYAAETGVNSAIAQLKNDPNYTNETCNASTVTPLESNKFIFQTCVLVSSPSVLTYKINTTNSKLFLVRSQTAFNQLTFKWSPINNNDTVISAGTSCISSSGCFKPDSASDWGSQMGVLRLQVIAIKKPNVNPVSRSIVSSNTYDLIGIPESSTVNSNNTFSTPIPVEATKTVPDSVSGLLSGSCNISKECSLVMNNLIGGEYDYYVRAFSYYKDIRLDVSGAISGNTSTEVRFTGSQVTIDSTGRSGDVLRRVKVAKTLDNSSDVSSLNSSTSYLPPFVLSASDGLCKKLETNPNSTTVANSAAVCN